MTTQLAEKATTRTKRGRPVTKTSTLLINAKKVLEEGRWTRGCLKKGSAHCAMGALYTAAGVTWDKNGFDTPPFEIHTRISSALNVLNEVVYVESGAGIGMVAFNDDVARSKKDVLGIYDKAIANAKTAERKKVSA